MLTIVRSDTPMYLVSQKRYAEARIAVYKFTNSSEDKEAVFEYLKNNTSNETNTVTYKEVFTNPKYRR